MDYVRAIKRLDIADLTLPCVLTFWNNFYLFVYKIKNIPKKPWLKKMGINIKVQLFWEGHKNHPYGFEIYLVDVKTMKTIAQIFVAFSEKMNFNMNDKWLWWAVRSCKSLPSKNYCPLAVNLYLCLFGPQKLMLSNLFLPM